MSVSHAARSMPRMENKLIPDIVIVRDGEAYRLLHGHLRLANVLRTADAVSVEVRGEGSITVIKTAAGLCVGKDGQQLPLHRH